MWLLSALLLLWASACWGADPRFDPTTLMRLVLVPADAAVGSVIYRLRASDEDFDYPLQFDLVGDGAKSVVSIETLACTKYNSVCQANVLLLRRLDPGRYYDFRVSVRDTKGGSAVISCSISTTNYTTPRDTIFPHVPGLIMIPEDAKRGTDLDYVVARKNSRFTKPVYLELWGSPLFAIRQKLVSAEDTEGTIFLLGPLDYEKQATHHLTVLANDAYAEPGQDSRNIAGLQIVVVVVDVQDMPPIFTMAPPITRLENSLLPGDIVAKVHAEDGDKGNPRDIRYGLVSEGNPFTLFFNISESTGEIILARPLDEITAISHVGDPIILTVIAEEVKLSRSEPDAMSTTVELAFILGDRGNQPPYFPNDNYIARIDENSLQGTSVMFSDPYIPEISDDDMGKNGVFALSLENNNGTFEISPSVGERHTNFLISVRDNTMLDYEVRKTVRFKIVAQELGPTSNLSTSVDVVVFLNDINDNPPLFLKNEYMSEFAENATAGTKVTQVEATDLDTGLYGKVRYTQILGYLNTSLSLDPESGLITLATSNHGFDCEAMPEYKLYVEATDENGVGNRATVPLIIKLIDVNDEKPQFEKPLFEFILSPSLRNFTFPAFIKAIDKDVSAPNNIVRYEITHGNYENKFILNEITGELTLREPLVRKNRSKRQANKEAEVYILTARAYDLGVPHLSSTCQINIYPPESRARTMLFIVPGKNPDRQQTEETLAAITGGKVTIQEVRPYSGDEIGATDVTSGDSSKERSVVVASVSYNKHSVIDVDQLKHTLGRNRTVIQGQNTYTEDSNAPYRAESSVLFWMLMLLALLIILAIIILILCCICSGCPLYMPPKKRIIRVNSTDDDVHLVVKEKGINRDNKSVQARKEAWSADLSDSKTRPTQWQFNKRIKEKITMTPESEDYNREMHFKKQIHADATMKLHEGPKVIYSREMQNRNKEERDIYVEDYEGDYTLSKNNIRRHMMEEEYDTESLRRHEIDRGSERGYRKTDIEGTDSFRRKVQRQTTEDQDDAPEHLYIREGNTEILRLITRGRQEDERAAHLQQRPMTLVQQPQYILVDSGKNILMQRFIEQQMAQQDQQNRQMEQNSNIASVILPNEVLNMQTELNHFQQSNKGSETGSGHDKNVSYNLINQELLETSLRQQNEILRQILLEKERLEQKQTVQQEEVRLETQSLPSHSVMATQTDCNTATQTDPQYLRPPRRRIRSDNDDSPSDDDFHLYIVKNSNDANRVRWMKRRKKYKHRRSREDGKNRKVVAEIRRCIKTPIMEESESPIDSVEKKSKEDKNYPETKKSVLKKLKSESNESEHSRRSPLQKDVLIEISESLENDQIVPSTKNRLNYHDSDSEDENVYAVKAGKITQFFSEDSLDYEDEGVASERSNKNMILVRHTSSADTLEIMDENKIRVKSIEKIYTHDSNENLKDDTRKYHSALDLRERKSANINENIHHDEKKVDKKKLDLTKSTPRYMQWYNKNKTQKKNDENEKKVKKSSKITKSLMADTKSSSIKKVFPVEKKDKEDDKKIKMDVKGKEKTEKPVTKDNNDASATTSEQKPFHHLVQHSEYRYEHPYTMPQALPAGQLPAHVYPQPTVQYVTTASVPTHVITLLPSSMASSIPVQTHEPPQPVPRTKTPEKPPRPTLMKKDNTKPSQQSYLRAPGTEEDYDSGIAMASLVQDAKKRNQMTEKKSVFTIAYDDMQTKQLRPESTTPPF